MTMNLFVRVRAGSCWFVATGFLVCSTASWAAGGDPQSMLKDAERQSRAGDTRAAMNTLREVIDHPRSEPYLVIDAVKLFVQQTDARADSAAVRHIFSRAFAVAGPRTSISPLLALLIEYRAFSDEEKLSVLAGLSLEGKGREELLDARIQLLRRLGRHALALDLAAQLSQLSGKLDHKLTMVDLLLDLSRSADAYALANDILKDLSADPGAYAALSERFYRHGDYRNALNIHRMARAAFSNASLFFEQSLSICQGLQLGPEGIELCLPGLLAGAAPVPEYFKDFLAVVGDGVFLTEVYPVWISGGQNPNLYLSALFRFADLASDSACRDFAGQYVLKFRQFDAHLALAEQLLLRDRLPWFLQILKDVPDTPQILAENKKLMLFKYVLQTQGPREAESAHPPGSFAMPAVRASCHRLLSDAFLRQDKLQDAVRELQEAHALSASPADDLQLARLYFLAGSDSEALNAAHRAHSAWSTDETLYWLGWLSFLQQDTETARTSLRDMVLRPESFLADESLAWLIVLTGADQGLDVPGKIGAAMRAASRGRRLPAEEESLPVSARLALWTEALRSGLDAKFLPAEGSPFLQFLRWESLKTSDRAEGQYQKLLLGAPEHLRSLIRTEEP